MNGELSAWANFYVIVGSSAAALTGLQFVVMAVIADLPRRETSDVDAFGTPTIVHLCAVLLIAAIGAAPWPSVVAVAVALGVCGAAGVVYMCIVVRRALRAHYQPVTEDWIWHIVIPFVAYATLSGAAAALFNRGLVSLFVVAASALLLLFDAIHNAWDTVTYMVTGEGQIGNQ